MIRTKNLYRGARITARVWIFRTPSVGRVDTSRLIVLGRGQMFFSFMFALDRPANESSHGTLQGSCDLINGLLVRVSKRMFSQV